MTADTMSFTRLRCDARGCTREYPEGGPVQGGAAFTRDCAEAAAWSRSVFGGDLCPEHRDAPVDDLNPTGRLTG